MSKSTGTNVTPIYLYQFPKDSSHVSNSGFCMKLEAYLRFADLKYEHKDGSPLKAPKKKLPYITYGPSTVSDTRFILQFLDSKKGDLNSKGDLDTVAGLTAVEKSSNNAYRAQMEELLYFCVVQERFGRDKNKDAMAQEAFGHVPWVVRGALVWYVRRSMSGAINSQGIGRHTDAEIDNIAGGVIDDIETKLASNGESGPWFNGAKGPCTIDATVYGMFATALESKSNPSAQARLLQKPNIVKYMKAITTQYFPEYEDLLSILDGKK